MISFYRNSHEVFSIQYTRPFSAILLKKYFLQAPQSMHMAQWPFAAFGKRPDINKADQLLPFNLALLYLFMVLLQ